MSDSGIPDFIRGAPWKALIALTGDDGAAVVHVWAVDAEGAPDHAEAMISLGLVPEQVSSFAVSNADLAEVYGTDDRSAAEALIRARIPDVEFVQAGEWHFG